MAIEPGTRLGSYEVSAQIGEGGMGEVYRARDTKLDRDVALKVLPEASCPRHSRVIRSGSRASSARRSCWPRSTTRTSPRSTASRTAAPPTRSSSNSSRGRRFPSCCRNISPGVPGFGLRAPGFGVLAHRQDPRLTRRLAQRPAPRVLSCRRRAPAASPSTRRFRSRSRSPKPSRPRTSKASSTVDLKPDLKVIRAEHGDNSTAPQGCSVSGPRARRARVLSCRRRHGQGARLRARQGARCLAIGARSEQDASPSTIRRRSRPWPRRRASSWAPRPT